MQSLTVKAALFVQICVVLCNDGMQHTGLTCVIKSYWQSYTSYTLAKTEYGKGC